MCGLLTFSSESLCIITAPFTKPPAGPFLALPGTIPVEWKCNNFETVLDFARSVLKLVVLDSHKTYRT